LAVSAAIVPDVAAVVFHIAAAAVADFLSTAMVFAFSDKAALAVVFHCCYYCCVHCCWLLLLVLYIPAVADAVASISVDISTFIFSSQT
jgi:hypothetical protein